jgi:hypothetical protein
MGNLAGRGEQEGPRAARSENGREDDDDAVPVGGKKASAYVMNRTQQKINLQRASSSLEPNIAPHHPAMVALSMPTDGPMPGGYGRGETVLPKFLERTGMQYLVVRRYQNPIARSLARLAQVPGQDKKLRIPKPGARTPAHSRQGSELRSGPVQNLRDREGTHGRADVAGLGLIGGRGERRPGSRRGYQNGAGDGLDDQATGLSGSSLVDGGEDATTLAVLRNLWDKNMDLSASQE